MVFKQESGVNGSSDGPPPPSMLVDPRGGDDKEGASTNLAAIETDESARSTLIIEATLVQEEQVYDATPIQDEEELDEISVQNEDNEEEVAISWWKRHGRTGVFLVSAVVISVLATLLATSSRAGGNSNSREQMFEGQNTSSESPIIPQTNTEESPIIPERNATAEVSGILLTL